MGRETAAGSFERFGGLRRLLVPPLSIVFAILAVVAVRAVLRDVGPAQVRAALAAIRPGRSRLRCSDRGQLRGAFELRRARGARRRARPDIGRRAAIAGATSHAVSNLLGFGAVTAGAMRYRLYTAAGLDAADVLRIYANSSVTFWFGFVAVLAAALILDPGDVTALRPLGIRAEIFLGVALAAALAVGIVWLGRDGRVLRFARCSLPLPRARRRGRADPRRLDRPRRLRRRPLRAAAAGGRCRPFPISSCSTPAPILLGLLSHAPGGFGVFEAAIIAALGQTMSAGVVAGADRLSARLLRRALRHRRGRPRGLGGLSQQAPHLRRARSRRRGFLRPLVPTAAALIAFLSGVLLLFSVALGPRFRAAGSDPRARRRSSWSKART